MIQDKRLNELGQEFASQNFISEIEKNHFQLKFEQETDVEVFKLNSSYLFKADVASLPKTNTEAFITRLMQANLFGTGTRGAVLGLNENGNILTLSLEVDYNSPYKEFKNKLEEFVNTMDFWRQEIIKHQ